MTEDLLHYIWKYQRFNTDLKTVEGSSFEVISPGTHNFNSGPDFLNAKIKINDTIWAGNVEIHIKSSDWFKHKHNMDMAYNTVIMHVVWENDDQVCDKKGNIISTLVLKNNIDSSLIERYKYFIENKSWIPCEKLLHTVNPFIIFSWLESLSIERLQDKTDAIFKKLLLSTNNWEKVFYEMLARNFGFNLNSDTFELLAKSLDIKYLAKHKNNLLQIEALFFGQAGLLNDDFMDEYPNTLKKEYLFLQNKFILKPIESHLWKFLRIRPGNFPTIRIAQFSSLIHKSSGLFSKIIEARSLREIQKFFMVDCSEYWETHYIFDVESKRKNKNLGSSSINLLLINTIIPFIFAFGSFKKEQRYKDKAIDFLDAINAEQNHIIRHFLKSGIVPENALQSQALIQLYHNYCLKKKCLNCSIGDALLKTIN